MQGADQGKERDGGSGPGDEPGGEAKGRQRGEVPDMAVGGIEVGEDEEEDGDHLGQTGPALRPGVKQAGAGADQRQFAGKQARRAIIRAWRAMIRAANSKAGIVAAFSGSARRPGPSRSQ